MTDDDARDAARLLVEWRLPALLVVDREGRPYAAVPGSQLIGPLLPPDALTDPRYGAGLDARDLDGALERLAGLTVAEWLPRHRTRPPTVTTETSATQVATLMARTRVPLVAVVERCGDRSRLVSAVTAARLMERLVGGT
ncbi:CBS domain-containing protein [Streptomyces sp. NY05-11A]|uniref:CBS domain-containing protein n=1 Tax=Streptomyces soliscabiei TaxID=588897 RepID=UPI0029A19944|nr:CBS domain-containing protein [Streptomyces sp. NY05-11A]MDX2681683.1 CBS domain-containing protein [Streptomyces sp. NY05-11A]